MYQIVMAAGGNGPGRDRAGVRDRAPRRQWRGVGQTTNPADAGRWPPIPRHREAGPRSWTRGAPRHQAGNKASPSPPGITLAVPVSGDNAGWPQAPRQLRQPAAVRPEAGRQADAQNPAPKPRLMGLHALRIAPRLVDQDRLMQRVGRHVQT
jgi:hypothetical protein